LKTLLFKIFLDFLPETFNRIDLWSAIAYGGRFAIAGRGRFAIASASSPVHSIQQLSCHLASPKVGKIPVFLLIDNSERFHAISANTQIINNC
jgi:hypothetical protein